MKCRAASSRHIRGLVGAAALSGLLHAAFLIWLAERLPLPSEDASATELTVTLTAPAAPRQEAAAKPAALDSVAGYQQEHQQEQQQAQQWAQHQARAQREPPAEAQSAPPSKSHPPSPPRTAAPAEPKPKPKPKPKPVDDAEVAAAPPPAASAAPAPTPPAERAIAPVAPPRTAPVANEAQLARARARHHALREARTELARHFRYPPLAQRNGWEGTVVLGFRVSEDGAIEGIVIARTSGHGLLDRAARDALARVGRLHGFAGARGIGALDLELPVIYRLTES